MQYSTDITVTSKIRTHPQGQENLPGEYASTKPHAQARALGVKETQGITGSPTGPDQGRDFESHRQVFRLRRFSVGTGFTDSHRVKHVHKTRTCDV